jgi:hypothetical protein
VAKRNQGSTYARWRYHGLDLQLINNMNKKNVYYKGKHSQSTSSACGAASSGETRKDQRQLECHDGLMMAAYLPFQHD